jgi:hypothetical protein
MKSIYKKVLLFVTKLQPNEIFTASDIGFGSEVSSLVNQALSRLTKEKYIARLSRGKYYIPHKTKFGSIKPSDSKIIEKVITEIYKKTKVKPYFASNTIFQKLGLTTQVSSEIFLVCNITIPYNFKINNLKFNLIRYEGTWNKSQTKYFEFLYALQNIKKIPDTTCSDSYAVLKNIMKNYTIADITNTMKISKEFNNQTRALLGCMLDMNGYKVASDSIKKELNSSTNYYVDIDTNEIPIEYKRKWRIYEPSRKQR